MKFEPKCWLVYNTNCAWKTTNQVNTYLDDDDEKNDDEKREQS